MECPDPKLVWEDCVGRQDGLMRAGEVLPFFFLHPNQHDTGSKPFSDEELTTAFLTDEDDKHNIRHHYSQITEYYAASREGIVRLQNAGVSVTDLTRIYLE